MTSYRAGGAENVWTGNKLPSNDLPVFPEFHDSSPAPIPIA